MRNLVYILLLVVSFSGKAQDGEISVAPKIDSIWQVDSLTKEDKVQYIYDISWLLITADADSAIFYAEMLMDSARHYNFPIYEGYGHSTKAESYIMKANYKRAIEEHKTARKIYERVDHKMGIGATLMNMGLIYFHLDDHETAQKFIKESLHYDKILKDTIGMVHTLKNLAVSHKRMKEFDEALNLTNQALELIEGKEEGHMGLLASVYGTKGSLYMSLNDYDKAYQSLRTAHEISKNYDIPEELIVNKNNLSMYYEHVGKLDLAAEYAKGSFDLSKQTKSVHGLENAAEQLANVYEKLGEHEQALKYYKSFITYRDSIKNDRNIEEMTRLEVEHDYELKAAKDSIRVQKEKEVLAAEKEWAERLNYAFFGGGALAIIFAIFLYNRYRVIGKQKKIIEEQKDTVEEQRDIANQKQKEAEEQHRLVEQKNREIIDSIQYARRLQSAILPSIADQVKSLFSDAFVYYVPKDIVAGDFYWCEKVDNVHYIAAADCTGHGVPGAMVSVMCSSALTKALIEDGIKDPGAILDRVRELIVERFEKSGESVNDGMDISLAAIHYDSDKENAQPIKMEWAGANNPLWIFRKASSDEVSQTDRIKIDEMRDYQFIQLRPDKQPVGKSFHAKPFTTVTCKVQENDQLYLFSDGYFDQFGGDTFQQRNKGGKKLKTKAFRDMLLDIRDQGMEQQGQTLEHNFIDWKGTLEQVDDVCVIGVRL